MNRKMNRTRHAMNNSFWGMVVRVLHMVFPVLIRAIIIRTLGPTYVGVSGLFKNVLAVLNLSELGFGPAIVYMMYKPIAENDIPTVRRMISLLRRAYQITGAIMLAVGLLLVPFLKILVKDDVSGEVNIYMLYGMYLFHTVFSYWMFAYKNSIFTSHQMTEVNYRIYTIVAIIQYSLQMVMLFVTKNYYLYMLVYALMVIPQNLMFHFSAKRRFPDLYCEGTPTKEEFTTLFNKIKTLIGHRLGNTILYSIDNIIISAVLGNSYIVEYSSYHQLLSSVATFLTVMRTSSLASVGNKIVTDTRENTYKFMLRTSFMWVGLVGFCTGCFSLLFQPFMALWMGEKYLYSEPLMLCFCLYFFVWQFRAVHMVIKDAAGLWEADWLKPYIGMASNLVFSILFVKVTGSITGAMIPTMLILLLLYFPWEVRVLFKKFFMRSGREYVARMARFSITALAGAGVTFAVGRLLPDRGVFALIMRVPVCAIMPLLYLALNFNTNELKESVKYVKALVNRALHRRRLPGRP